MNCKSVLLLSTTPSFILCFREATTFQKAWKREDVTAVEEVRALPDFVGKIYFP